MSTDVAMCPDCYQMERGVPSPGFVACGNAWHSPESKTPAPEPDPGPEAGWWTHGLASAYRGGCRCDPCQAAHAERARRERDDRAARLAADPSLATHGSSFTYTNWRCRCEKCVQAHSARMAAQREQRKVTGSGALPASYYKEAGMTSIERTA